MKLIVGLGNIGPEYERTRHNIGFILLDDYLEKNSLLSNMRNGYKGEYIKNSDTYFLKPTTYMNLSGDSIYELASYFKIKPTDIYVIYDDMDLEIGKIRIRDKGSSGGHNGIKSIISKIGNNFNRIRIGIGSKGQKDTISHVLGKFTPEELEIINNKKATINKLIDDIIKDISINNLKNKYNNK